MRPSNTLWNIVGKSSEMTILAYTSNGKICDDCRNDRKLAWALNGQFLQCYINCSKNLWLDAGPHLNTFFRKFGSIPAILNI